MSLNRDLTVGKPGKVLLRFCLPLFASIIFQQLYNIADSFVAENLSATMRLRRSATAMK